MSRSATENSPLRDDLDQQYSITIDYGITDIDKESLWIEILLVDRDDN